MKKLIILISVALAAVVAGTSVFLFAGCGEQDYPLEIAGCKLDREPENVIVLDPATADIMAFMSYDRRFAGRSDSVTQPELAFAPSVGTESEPNINAIRGLKPDFVFCNEKLSDEAAAELNSYNIPFVKLQGLIPEAQYRLEGTEEVYSGGALMYGGYSFPLNWGDYAAHQLYFTRI